MTEGAAAAPAGAVTAGLHPQQPAATAAPLVLQQPTRGERRDLNPRPLGPQPSALPTELRSPRSPALQGALGRPPSKR